MKQLSFQKLFVIFLLIAFSRCIKMEVDIVVLPLNTSASTNQDHVAMENLNNSLDILKEISIESLKLILIELKSNWPNSIRAHHYIYSFVKNYGKNINSNRFKPKIYMPRYTDTETNLTLIGVTEEDDYWIMLFTLEERAHQLKECLKNTKLINWNTKVKPKISIEIEFAEDVLEILINKRSDWNYSIERFYYFSQNNDINITNSYDSNLKIEALNQSHSDLINEKWPHKYNGSKEFIKDAIKLNGGFGIFVKNEIVSWIILNDLFALGNLFTIEKKRRKGYSELLTKVALNNFLNTHRMDALVYIMKNNVASEKLFKKIGFEFIKEIEWIF